MNSEPSLLHPAIGSACKFWEIKFVKARVIVTRFGSCSADPAERNLPGRSPPKINRMVSRIH
jgi:hypothetical protein